MSRLILLTGPPGCGKTTLLREIALKSGLNFAGFYTEEIRQENKRIGFKLVSLDGRTSLLASKSIKSRYRVGSYGVALEKFDSFLDTIRMNLFKSAYVLIDEIGKMELLSSKFKSILRSLLQTDATILASIIYRSHPEADIIKKRPDAQLIELNRADYTKIRKTIIESIETTA